MDDYELVVFCAVEQLFNVRPLSNFMSEPTSPQKPPKNTGIFPDAQWFCIFLICFTGYLFATKPTQTLPQLIFRVSIMLAGVIGLVVIWIRKKKQ